MIRISTNYRPDIDGLRAIAVLAVVTFHAFPDLIRGGFVGVDIFFVISGYLITNIILDSLKRDRFSFFEFYARRVKRIFPALILVLLVSFVFGWFVLFADEFKQLGKHIAGASTFLSNYILLNEQGYFDIASNAKPLLHLWSLAVEEQFYIFWPFLIWAAYKKRFNPTLLIALIALSSFLINLYKARVDGAADFFLPQTRYWELMAGSLLSWKTFESLQVRFTPPSPRNQVRRYLRCLGLVIFYYVIW